MDNNQKRWSLKHTFALIFFLVCMVVLSIGRPFNLQATLVFNSILLFIFILVAGYGVTGRFFGLFIDNRNKWSLSKFQMILWTVVILSGYFTAAMHNIFAETSMASGPLAIKIPEQLWLLMGISTTSLIGSPLLLSPKKEKKADESEKTKTLEILAREKGFSLNEIKKKVDSVGQIVVNEDIKDAGVSDLFKGEETGNAGYLDMAKIQMLFFTIILIIAYFVMLFTMFKGNNIIQAFPELDSSMIALLGISHGGYLTNKAIPHSKTKK